LRPSVDAANIRRPRFEEADVAKNILIFSDGTGQAGGLVPDERRSNVYKLFRAVLAAELLDFVEDVVRGGGLTTREWEAQPAQHGRVVKPDWAFRCGRG
jgi:hypothetical protein